MCSLPALEMFDLKTNSALTRQIGKPDFAWGRSETMEALCATPHNLLLKAFYQTLRGRGKPAKVALTAVMRKLRLHLKSLLKAPLQTTT